jgi:RNA polymerase sigma-70 factor (ECF subfamily)
MTYGDPVSEALEMVVARSIALVRAAALQHGLDAADLDELLQDVRFRVWRAHPDSAAIAAATAPYVYRTAATAALDMVRGRQRAQRRRTDRARAPSEGGVRSFDALTKDVPGDETPAGILDAKELERAVEFAVQRIRPARRSVVRMYLRGHPLAEIAHELRWSQAKTRSLLYRGLAGVRAELAACGYAPP